MKTPIYDFLVDYQNAGTTRFHMPGHKGKGPLGCEAYDLTEVNGADSLYEAEGIIASSEANASALFHSKHTFYSTEGSSQCIRAMLYLATMNHPAGTQPVILAARNVHKAFIYAAALLDLQIEWVWPTHFDSICQCDITASDIEEALSKMEQAPAAVYVTSPNYLGNLLDIRAIADVCHRYGTLLVVDNAHGAYLAFLEESLHPLHLGADLVCDSAHKTLPVLTGGAYLHISNNLSAEYVDCGKQALALFGSTSPSYLIMASLDCCNDYLENSICEELMRYIPMVERTKELLEEQGWQIEPSDPLKISIATSDGIALAERLRENGIECEYAEKSYLVLMLTPNNTKDELDTLIKVLGANTQESPASSSLPLAITKQAISIREAVFGSHRTLPVEECEGLICGSPTVACPPAIPIVVSGERITNNAIALFQYYGIHNLEVMR